MSCTFRVAPARPEEWAVALRLAFADSPAEQQARRVSKALELLQKGELDPGGLLVARGDAADDLRGALLCCSLAGACGLLWPPHALAGAEARAIQDALVREGTGWLQRRGAKLAQALLEVAHGHFGDPLLRNGFRAITRLWFLRHSLCDLSALPSPDPQLTFLTSDTVDTTYFQEIHERTYQGTLDCPELNGVRTMAEVHEGHRAQGRHDPQRWFLAQYAGRPAGVLLLNELPDLGCWEVAYIGVVPEARRQGIGRQLLARAIRMARACGTGFLSLSVDVRNHPAWSLYAQLGFEPFDERLVYLAVWGPDGVGR